MAAVFTSISSHRFSRLIVKTLPVLGCLLLLSACSSLQLAYSFADDVLEDRASDYLDLDEAGERHLSERTDALFAWHRQEMMPKYAVFFTEQAELAESGGWSRAQIDAAFDDFRILVDETAKGASPFIADVLIDHSAAEKRAYLQARLTERLQERRKEGEEETFEENVDKWVERRVDNFARFVGSLEDDQVAIIRRYTEEQLQEGLRWLENMEQRHQALIGFLETSPDRDATAAFLHRLMIRPQDIVDPDYVAVSAKRWTLIRAMYFDVLASLSPRQRRELIETLRDYADDMRDIASS